MTIQSEACNGRKLIVTGIIQHDDQELPAPSQLYEFSQTIIRIDIDGFIKEAKAKGWAWGEQGEDFRLCALNEMFRLYGFWEKRPKEWYQGRNYESECGTWPVKDGLIEWPSLTHPKKNELISFNEAFLRNKAHRSKTRGDQDAS